MSVRVWIGVVLAVQCAAGIKLRSRVASPSAILGRQHGYNAPYPHLSHIAKVTLSPARALDAPPQERSLYILYMPTGRLGRQSVMLHVVVVSRLESRPASLRCRCAGAWCVVGSRVGCCWSMRWSGERRSPPGPPCGCAYVCACRHALGATHQVLVYIALTLGQLVDRVFLSSSHKADGASHRVRPSARGARGQQTPPTVTNQASATARA